MYFEYSYESDWESRRDSFYTGGDEYDDCDEETRRLRYIANFYDVDDEEARRILEEEGR